MITSDGNNLQVHLNFKQSCKLFESQIGLIFIIQKHNPPKSRVIINNHKSIIVTTYFFGPWGTKKVHMKKLKRSRGWNYIFQFKRDPCLLPHLTRFTYMVFFLTSFLVERLLNILRLLCLVNQTWYELDIYATTKSFHS